MKWESIWKIVFERIRKGSGNSRIGTPYLSGHCRKNSRCDVANKTKSNEPIHRCKYVQTIVRPNWAPRGERRPGNDGSRNKFSRNYRRKKYENNKIRITDTIAHTRGRKKNVNMSIRLRRLSKGCARHLTGRTPTYKKRKLVRIVNAWQFSTCKKALSSGEYGDDVPYTCISEKNHAMTVIWVEWMRMTFFSYEFGQWIRRVVLAAHTNNNSIRRRSKFRSCKF